MTWMLYGAYGYTGRITAEEAVSRGYAPLLAGRSAEKLAPLAERLGLEHVAFSLDDEPAMREALGRVGAVVHAAGPFVYTSKPMVHACLATGTHYLDITGEIPVFEHTFLHDEDARTQGVALLSGVGFDVVPTDCLAVYVAGQIEEATHLEIAFSAGNASGGTTKTGIEMMSKASGMLVRRDGHYEHIPMGSGAREVVFAEKGARSAMPIPWGDLATAYRSTGIPNITTYMAFHPDTIAQARRFGGLMQAVLRIKPVRQAAINLVERTLDGPTEEERRTGRAHIWARAANAGGESAEAWLTTPESYHLTAASSILAAERVLEGGITGALTPAQAFGADYVLAIEGTRRYDSLEEAAAANPTPA